MLFTKTRGISLSNELPDTGGWPISVDDVKKIVAERVDFHCRRELSGGYLRAMKPDDVSVLLRHDADAMMIQFRKSFLKSLAKTTHEPALEVVNLDAPYPDRPVDYLITFLESYFPYLSRFKKTKSVTIETKIVYNEMNQEHYHLIPAELYEKKPHVEFLYWDGGNSYYDGAPGEWEALKMLEQACLMSDRDVARSYCVSKALSDLQDVRRG